MNVIDIFSLITGLIATSAEFKYIQVEYIWFTYLFSFFSLLDAVIFFLNVYYNQKYEH